MTSTSKSNAKRLEWSARADRDLFDAWAYIYQDNPKAADDVAGRIHQAAGKLSTFPMIGKLSGYYQTRALPVTKTQFTIYYRVTAKSVIVVRVVHQRQNFPR